MGGFGSGHGSGGTRPGAGRPVTGRARKESIHIRVTAQEKTDIQRRAAAMKLTVAEYMMWAAWAVDPPL